MSLRLYVLIIYYVCIRLSFLLGFCTIEVGKYIQYKCERLKSQQYN